MSDFQDFLDNTLNQIDIHSWNHEENYEVKYDIFKEIQEKIIALRDESQMTQKQLSEKSGLTQSNISNIEKGVSVPTIITLKKIADAAGKRLVIEFADMEERI